MPLSSPQRCFTAAVSFVSFLCSGVAPAQQAPAPAADLEAAAAIQAPNLPGEAATSDTPAIPAPVSPPLPGEVTAPAPAPGNRIPDAWVNQPASPVVPRVSSFKPEVSRSTSSSGQFIVHGPELQIRSAVARRCEDVAEELRQALRDRQPWALPVVIHLRGPEESPDTGPTVSTQITEMDHGGFHLQVTVLARKDLRLRDLQDELIRVLLAERILRSQKAINSGRERLLPDWVFTGVTEAARYRERNRPSALFAVLFESGKIYSIEEIIEASPVEMDSLSRAIYDTSCCALVLALLDQPEGPERFQKFLGSLASDPRPERELLNQWFPSFAATPSSLNKWWALQLAELSQPTVAEPLGPSESYTAIKQALVLNYQAKLDEAPPSARPDLTPPSPKPASKPSPPPARETPASPAPPKVAKAESPPKEETSDPVPDSAPKEDAGAMEEDRNVFGKIFGFLKKDKTGEDAGADETMEEVAAIQEPDPAPVEEPTPVPEKVDETKTAKAQEPAPPKESATASEETMPSEEESEPKKKSFFKNLFRGKKSDSEDQPAEESGEETSAIPADPNATALRWLSPSGEWLVRQLLPMWQQGESREVFLKFLRKKKEGEDAAADDETPGSEASEPPQKVEPEVEKPSPPPPPKPQSKPAPKPDLSKIVPIVNVSSPIEEYAWMMRREDRDSILGAVETRLSGLESRVGVLFRPIILGYKSVIADLKKGKSKGVDDKLKALAVLLERAKALALEVQAHVDWYQASHSAAYSGLFDDYLRLPETIRKEAPPRTDPISSYLDALEKEFSE